MTEQKEDLETIIVIYDKNNTYAWDLNGQKINLKGLGYHNTFQKIKNAKPLDFGEKISDEYEKKIFSDKNNKYVATIITFFDKTKNNKKITLECIKENPCMTTYYVLEENFPKDAKISALQIPKTMSIVPLGIGNAFSAQNDNTCFILDADKPYLIDCPEDLKKLGRMEEKINDIILTHNDPDHVGALRKLIQKKCFKYDTKINLYSTLKIYEDFMKSLYTLQEELESHVNFIRLSTYAPYKNKNGLKIDIRGNLHGNLPTIGLKFEYKNKKLGYSSDCNSSKNFLDRWYRHCIKKAKRACNFSGEITTTESLTGGSRPAFENMADNIRHIRYLEGELGNFGCEDNFESFETAIFPLKTEAIINFAQALTDYATNVYKKASPSWFSDCDFIIHEATSDQKDFVHTNIKELEYLPNDIISKLFLAHIPDDLDTTIPIMEPKIKYLL